MLQKKSASKITKWILGVFFLTGSFCPCRGFSFHIPSTPVVEKACCEHCADEQKSVPDHSEHLPQSCQCGCCDSFLAPEKGDCRILDDLTNFVSAIPVHHPAGLLVIFPDLTSHLQKYFASPPLSQSSLLPELGSLLI
jgi:hypothetical protein